MDSFSARTQKKESVEELKLSNYRDGDQSETISVDLSFFCSLEAFSE